jgi:excisionase family DNA binding protein
VPTLYKVTEVATTLKVRPPTIYNWVDQGKLPHIRIGRLIRFTPEQIDEFLRRSSRGPSELPLDDGGERSDRESDKPHLDGCEDLKVEER